VLGGAFKKITASLAPAIEKQWVATLIQGVRALPVHVESCWSMAAFFKEPGMANNIRTYQNYQNLLWFECFHQYL